MQKIDLSKFVGERCKVTYRNGKTANCFVRERANGLFKLGARTHSENGTAILYKSRNNFDIVAIEVMK